MTQYMSIKDVAEYLEVDYKTVYRLVRKGEIASSQVGRVYRIRKADVEAYLSQSSSGIRQYEPVGRPAPLKCASCMRLLRDTSEIGGRCEAHGCTEPICTTCWAHDGRRTCAPHRPSEAERLEAARAALDAGEIPVLVTALQAGQRERAYLARFDAKMQRLTRLLHPATGEMIVPDRPWAELRETEDAADRLMGLLRTGFLATETEQTLPLNRLSRYRMPGRKRGELALVLEARCFAHLSPLVAQGFDTAPATAEEATRLLDAIIAEAEAGDATTLVGLASPTGWSAEARALVDSEETGRAFYHPLVLPYLVDLAQMGVIFNPDDARLPPRALLFAPMLLEEGIARVTEAVVRALVTDSRVTVAEIARETGIDGATIGQALARLIEAGTHRVEVDPALGQVVRAVGGGGGSAGH